MLSIKDLVKVYQTKTGESVRALDGVSIDFPKSGMVFLLGKSGSGKSTLLNVAGGLDFPTEGEIIVDGRSSKDFSIADFDGYRNSHIGFVFQEFNMLEEFTVGQNIALALQLQNKEKDDNAVKEILDSVDLSGVENRRPNTLSGGQKQRVAIARALIKNPKIIMADEPTGALDSTTGKQIFETLKKLSSTRLVLVVTHDRDFAEEYGDRIIELKDGKILSDMTKGVTESADKNVTVISEDTVKINDWDKVTETDLKEIAKIMKRSGSTVITTRNNLAEDKKAVLENVGCSSSGFTPTVKTERGEYNGENVDFIKSRLPFKNAFKMAFESLKLKPIRLAFTVILSIIAFIFFGVSATFMLYDPNYSVATALTNSEYKSIVLEKQYGAEFSTKELGSDGKTVQENTYTEKLNAAFTAEEIERLNRNNQDLRFAGIMDLGAYENNAECVKGYKASTLLQLMHVSVDDNYKNYFSVRGLCGYSDCGEEFLNDCGFNLITGRYPNNHSEIAVSNYIYLIYKYASEDSKEIGNFDYPTVNSFIGAKIRIDNLVFTVSGVYNVGEIPEKYNELFERKSGLDGYGTNKLKEEFADFIKYSFHTVGFVSKDFYDYHRYDNVELGNRTLNGAYITDVKPMGLVSSTSKNAVFTPKSIWQYDELISCYDFNCEKIDFAIDDYKIYLPITYVLNSLEKYAIKIQNREEQKYKDIYQVYLDYKYNRCTEEEKIFLTKTLIEDYENVLGVPLDLPKVMYIKNAMGNERELQVAGLYLVTDGKSETSRNYIVSDGLCDEFSLTKKAIYVGSDSTQDRVYVTAHVFNADVERYGRIITLTDNDMDQSMFMLNAGKNGDWYAMKNKAYIDANEIAEGVDMMKGIFYVAGGIFGLFAILMLFNFISVTVSSKQKEIGILRAIGARKSDVFKIFVIEALMITLTCFVISAILSAVACTVINGYLLTSAVGVTALDFGVLSVLCLLMSTIAVAAIATVIPVSKAANKAPVESIRQI
ncbi:MAG: ATP-binding cassette domain-containing protein [Clostridiales bacterium]|nr:ATP-binding cassette domain-containing protein [Clostridiales bacterium]